MTILEHFMTRISLILLSLVLLSACASSSSVAPSAKKAAAAIAAVDTELRPAITAAAERDIIAKRAEALASPSRPQLVMPDACANYMSFGPGAVAANCPDRLEIEGFPLEPTSATAALGLLDAFAAYGSGLQTLATSTAAQDATTAARDFVGATQSLAATVKAAKAAEQAEKLGGQLEKAQGVVASLSDLATARAICRQLTDGKATFYDAVQVLAVYADKRLDPTAVTYRNAFNAAQAAQRPIEAEANYLKWRKALASGPLKTLDEAVVAYNAVLKACSQ